MLEHVFGKNLHAAGKITGYVASVLTLLIIILMAIAVGFDIAYRGGPNYGINYVSRPLLVFAVLFYHSSILLKIGSRKNRHLMLIPWMINGCILMVIFFYVTSIPFSQLSGPNKIAILIRAVLATLIISLFGYVFYGTISLFIHIKDRATREKRKNRRSENNDHQVDAYPNYVKL